jgi:peptidyl-tRNA hydrolase, PTH1 family
VTSLSSRFASWIRELTGSPGSARDETSMASPKRLIVGLGNPGPQYEHTRHNIGFEVVGAIAEATRLVPTREKGDVLAAWGRYRSRPFGVAMPQTYMNRSGSAVLALLRRYGLQPSEILIIYDDLNLPPGTIRLRPQGSAGGHNGIQDIIDRLNTDAFPRMRIGIGSNFGRGRQSEYVLSPFTDEERPVMDSTVERARDAALTFITEGVSTAMNRFNG